MPTLYKFLNIEKTASTGEIEEQIEVRRELFSSDALKMLDQVEAILTDSYRKNCYRFYSETHACAATVQKELEAFKEFETGLRAEVEFIFEMEDEGSDSFQEIIELSGKDAVDKLNKFIELDQVYTLFKFVDQGAPTVVKAMDIIIDSLKQGTEIFPEGFKCFLKNLYYKEEDKYLQELSSACTHKVLAQHDIKFSDSARLVLDKLVADIFSKAKQMQMHVKQSHLMLEEYLEAVSDYVRKNPGYLLQKFDCFYDLQLAVCVRHYPFPLESPKQATVEEKSTVSTLRKVKCLDDFQAFLEYEASECVGYKSLLTTAESIQDSLVSQSRALVSDVLVNFLAGQFHSDIFQPEKEFTGLFASEHELFEKLDQFLKTRFNDSEVVHELKSRVQASLSRTYCLTSPSSTSSARSRSDSMFSSPASSTLFSPLSSRATTPSLLVADPDIQTPKAGRRKSELVGVFSMSP